MPVTPAAIQAGRAGRAEAKAISAKIGYPVLIKASAGGGGKGMRVVQTDAEFDEQMDRAVSEALSAFGDGSVFIEKYVTAPRHVEIQVLGDQHGTILHLFERECSVQRRHQKVVEEAPSAILTPEIRDAMGRAAVDVARACGYYGAGTVEFIVNDNLDFYFLEMNTRLQVEHPVTELITGIDLVKQMIYIAEGRPLALKQEDLRIKGHAVEVRVYAEDPANNFLPDVGTLDTYVRPQGNGVRVDDGFEQGMSIPIYYDPMIAKLITYGDSRDEAIEKMIRAIDEYQISGVQTTLSFGRFVMEHAAFRAGQFDTGFVGKYFAPGRPESRTSRSGVPAGGVDAPEPDATEAELAAVLAAWLLDNKSTSNSAGAQTAPAQPESRTVSRWKENRLR